MLPNLFLLAAPRSGSTQLTHWITQHHSIDRPVVKEPNFFASDDFRDEYVRRTHLDDVRPHRVNPNRGRRYQFSVYRDVENYQRLYGPIQSPWRLDASTSYLGSPNAPAKLARTIEDPRFIVLLRDPVERAISHHGLALRTGRTRRSLEDELDAELAGLTEPEARYLLEPSRYGAALDRWESTFEPTSFKFVIFEQMIADPKPILADIFAWLGIDDLDVDTSDDTMQNAGATARFARMNYMLNRSGAKTAIRALLSVEMKRRLKPLYFSGRPVPEIPSESRRRLEELLGPERRSVVGRTDAVASWWPPAPPEAP